MEQAYYEQKAAAAPAFTTLQRQIGGLTLALPKGRSRQ
jgi:hypothetical protein